jgi:hypothetical protein
VQKFNSEIIDEKEIKIPCNKNQVYLIKKSEKWKYSIEVAFNPYSYINIYNLYGIVQSYVQNRKFLCISIASAWLDKDSEIIIMDNNKASDIKKMDFYKFEKWFLNKLNYEKKYDPSKEFKYMILLTFGQNFIESYNKLNNKDLLKNLKPKFPWKISREEKIIKREINKNPILKYYMRKVLPH